MSDHLERNRRQWNVWAAEYSEPGRQAWASDDITWGILGVAERDLGLLGDVRGKRVIELGCGAAYFGSKLARRGAEVVGLDISENQLETARRLQGEFGLRFPLVQANAECTPFVSETFDLAFSEYGASIWADPYLWVPEAARLLRPEGELVFLVNGALLMLCMPDVDPIVPAGDRLLRPYLGMNRFEWQSDESVNFNLGHGAWIDLLRANGFEIVSLSELRAPDGFTDERFNLFAPEWAQRWPAEEIWKARKRD